MDELVMTGLRDGARETRVLLMHGPGRGDEGPAEEAVATPAHLFAGADAVRVDGALHDQRVRAVVSAESEDVLFGLVLCDGLGVARATLHMSCSLSRTTRRPAAVNASRAFGNFRGEHRLCRGLGR